MKFYSKKLMMKSSVVAIATALLAGCVGTTALSSGITNEGHVETSDIVFPDVSEAWNKDGLYPNIENINSIESGVSKEELYQLVGRPHFDEAKNAKEWDYIMKFKNDDNSTSVCQYKVIFDGDFKGREFYWKPASCAELAKAKPVQQVVTYAPTVVKEAPQPQQQKEEVNLSSDALFAFDKYSASDISANGLQKISQIANKLRGYQQDSKVRVVVTGHTDRLGDDAYNMTLSQLRAQTIKNVLVRNGVKSNNIIAVGAGSSEPVKQCSTSLPKNQQISCLAENRRVVVDITVN